MARSRKRASSSRGKRVRMDWVYRSQQYLMDGSTTGGVSPGGWSPVDVTVATGATNSAAIILLDSVNYTTDTVLPNNAAGDSGFVTGAGRPERSGGVVIRAVQGTLFVRPSTWAIGSIMGMGVRLTIAEQDGDDGIPELDADYSIMKPAAAQVPNNDITLFANQPGNLKTWYVYRQFSDNSAVIAMNLFWRGRRRLRPEECLFLHLEGNGPSYATSSVNMVVSSKVRTLVEVR